MPAVNLSRRTAGEGSGRTARVHVCEESERHITDESFEQRRKARQRRVRREGC